jgi:large repetitive protein
VGGATISYTDGTPKTVMSAGNGSYSLPVSYNWSGTVTPTKQGYIFSDSRTYNNVLADQPDQNYTPAAITYTISGNTGVGGVMLSYTDGSAKTANSAPDGSYSFTVSYNWSGTVTPSITGYTYSSSHTYTNVLTDQIDQNYTPTAITYTISGNTGAGGAMLSFTDGSDKTAVSAPDGTYSFTVSYNWSGTVTPSLSNYTFSPEYLTYNNILLDQTGQNYTSNASPVITESSPVTVLIDKNGSPTPFILTLHATDLDGDPLTWSIKAPASHGTASASGTGASQVISYTPVTNYIGADSFQVQVNDGRGETSHVQVNVTVRATTVPPALTLVSPANNLLTTTYLPRLDWKTITSMPSGTTFSYYQIWVAGNNTFSPLLIDKKITDPSLSEYTVESALDQNAAYYWKVRVCNTSTICSPWSSVWGLRTIILPTTLTAPDNGANLAFNRPIFDWENVAGASGYTFQIAKDAQFKTLVINTSVIPSTYTPSADLPANLTLYWRVQVKGTNGPSAWSDVSSFFTANPPSVPVLVSPTSGTLLLNDTPRLDWKDVTVPAGITFDHYHIQIASDSAFNTIIFEQNVPGSEITMVPGILTRNRNFYWRVNAWNNKTVNQSSSWSTVWTIRESLPKPVLSAPDAGAGMTTLRPIFNWSGSAETINYTLQISSSSAFSSNIVLATVTGTSYIPTADLPANKVLYWRVKANGANNSDWSDARSFTSANPPSIPTLVSPVNKYVTANYAPLLDWKDSTLPVGVTLDHYHVQVADNAFFNNPMVDTDTITNFSQFTIPSALNANQFYYWHVQSWSGAEHNSSYSTTWSFHTTLDVPAVSTMAVPQTNLRPAFGWTAVSGATGYTLQVSKVNTFSTTLINTNLTGGTLNAYTPTADLPAKTPLYYRMKANGSYPSAWSAPQSFTTANPPSIPVLLTPGNGTKTTSLTPVLNWKDGTVPINKYHLQVSSNPAFTALVVDLDVTDLPFIPGTALAANTKYYWRVNAWNDTEQYSQWSGVWTFTTPLH